MTASNPLQAFINSTKQGKFKVSSVLLRKVRGTPERNHLHSTTDLFPNPRIEPMSHWPEADPSTRSTTEFPKDTKRGTTRAC